MAGSVDLEFEFDMEVELDPNLRSEMGHADMELNLASVLNGEDVQASEDKQDHQHFQEHSLIPQPQPPVAAAATLPDDILFSEVLVRLPVKSLMRFKCVCPSWCAAIADADFIRRHLDHSRGIMPSILVTPRESSGDDDDDDEFSEDISFHRLQLEQALAGTIMEELMLKKVSPDQEDGITNKIFLTHCDGLVAITTTTNQVFVCNPATQEFVALPTRTPDFDSDEYSNEPTTAALGFDPHRNRYVVARYFYKPTSSSEDNNNMGHEVFWLGGDSTWSWKPTQDPPLPIYQTRPAFMGGAFYWKSADQSLLRFSLGDEAFETKFEVWQLADDRSSWSKRCQVINFDLSFGSEAFLPVWAGRGGMLLAVDYNKLYWYCDKSGSLKKVVDMEHEVDLGRREDGFYRQQIVPYIESLVSIRK
ncbi:hypothetical protein BRADI_5g07810v3 [Brachypodium distachyon]|uniref:F-box domain-containing protein n=1 Tax=Brachypodium distachyon TaxID=15368 RepID=A0A0Q3E383_BRADI|nr:hypothetical protein BRADI_5g07810v3 [Brachypodium distachyon]